MREFVRNIRERYIEQAGRWHQAGRCGRGRGAGRGAERRRPF